MKKNFLLCLAFLGIMLLAGCKVSSSTPKIGADDSLLNEHETDMISGASAGELHLLAEGEALGDGCATGYYYLTQRPDASFNIKYIDYASYTEVYLCDRPECEHKDESCTSWRPYAGSQGCAIPIGENLYILFYGSQFAQDFERYGSDALLHIERAMLNGSGAQTIVSLPAAESLNGNIATDGRFLYLTVAIVEKTEDEKTEMYWQILSIDLQSGNVQRSEALRQLDLHMIGAAGHYLIYTWYEAGGESFADIVDHYGVWNVETQTLEELPYEIDPQVRCAGEYLCWIDRGDNCLHRVNALTGEQSELPINLDLSNYQDVRFGYHTLPHYGIVLLYDVAGKVHWGLLSLESGELSIITLEIEGSEGAPKQKLHLYAEFDEEYFLVAQAYMQTIVNFPSGDSILPLPAERYSFALLPIESCLMNQPDYFPITSIE